MKYSYILCHDPTIRFTCYKNIFLLRIRTVISCNANCILFIRMFIVQHLVPLTVSGYLLPCIDGSFVLHTERLVHLGQLIWRQIRLARTQRVFSKPQACGSHWGPILRVIGCSHGLTVVASSHCTK